MKESLSLGTQFLLWNSVLLIGLILIQNENQKDGTKGKSTFSFTFVERTTFVFLSFQLVSLFVILKG
jgi:hypothetical protein